MIAKGDRFLRRVWHGINISRKIKERKMINKNIDINDINCFITSYKDYLGLGNCYNNIDKFILLFFDV